MYLAQLNIAKPKYPLDSPELKEFIDNLIPINQLAEESAGFIWRLKDDSGDATSFQPFSDPNIIVNMSSWASVDALKNFMFRTHHRNFLRRKTEWFENVSQDNYVLWWVPQDHMPTIEEAIKRLNYLREHTDSPYAFTFKSNFSAAEAVAYNAKSTLL